MTRCRARRPRPPIACASRSAPVREDLLVDIDGGRRRGLQIFDRLLHDSRRDRSDVRPLERGLRRATHRKSDDDEPLRPARVAAIPSRARPPSRRACRAAHRVRRASLAGLYAHRHLSHAKQPDPGPRPQRSALIGAERRAVASLRAAATSFESRAPRMHGLLHRSTAEAAVPAARRRVAAGLALPLRVAKHVEHVALALLLLCAVMFRHSSNGASTRRLSLGRQSRNAHTDNDR